jgi:4'-phosphopantetheinyl transferase EntD
VVAAKSRFAAVGVDCEIVLHVTRELWPSILTGREAEWVQSLAPGDQPAAVALLFSAKEAVYKCQYPLTNEWLDFHDLDVAAHPESAAQGEFTVRGTRPLTMTGGAAAPLRGRYRFEAGIVTAAIALASPALSTPCRRGTPSPPSAG